MDNLAPLSRSIYEDNEQKKLEIGIADGLISHFAPFIFSVLEDHQIGIRKHLLGRFETDAMLREIAPGFLRAPGEFDIHFLIL